MYFLLDDIIRLALPHSTKILGSRKRDRTDKGKEMKEISASRSEHQREATKPKYLRKYFENYFSWLTHKSYIFVPMISHVLLDCTRRKYFRNTFHSCFEK